MIIHFKSALNRIKAEDALVEKTEAYLRNVLREKHDNKIYIFKNRRPDFMKKKLITAACVALFVICGGTGAYAYYKTPSSYLSLDINPSVELGVNHFGKVVKAEAYNNDGSTILKGLDVTGSNVSEAVHDLIASAAKNGFIAKDGSSVISLTSETDNDKTAEELQKDAEDGAQDALKEDGDSAEIQKDNVALSRRDDARKLGITPGKLNLIQKLQAVDPTATVDQYKDATVKDIMKSIKTAKAKAKSKNNDQDSSSAAGSGSNGSSTAGTTVNTGTDTSTSTNVSTTSTKVNDNGNSNKGDNSSSNGNSSNNRNNNGNGNNNGNDNGNSKPKK